MSEWYTERLTALEQVEVRIALRQYIRKQANYINDETDKNKFWLGGTRRAASAYAKLLKMGMI